ncbi:MAG: FAD-binding protein, partial [Deltaproteobacteria bacterium]
MSGSPSAVDVLVVGAGLSGLNAARHLVDRGHAVRVIEARSRVGGRTWTIQLGGRPFDAGGQWTGPGQPRMTALIDELGLKTESTFHQGRKVLDLEGRVSTYAGTIPRISLGRLVRMQLALWRIEWLCRKVPREAPWEAAAAAAFDARSVADFLADKVGDPDVIALTNSAARVIFGADVEDLSLLHFLHYLHSGGGLSKLIETHGGNQDRSVVGGAQQLSEGLAARVEDVVLGDPVTAVEQDGDGVTVTTRSGARHRARRLVMAVPLPLVDRIRFDPPLPAQRVALQRASQMGRTVKCVVRYARPFWREAGLSGEAVCTAGPLNVVFDGLVGDGLPALLVFITGRPAAGWSDQDPARRHQRIVDSLVRWFGPEAAHPVEIHETDWSTEEFSGGAPVVLFGRGALSAHGTALRAPVGRIHWAG